MLLTRQTECGARSGLPQVPSEFPLSWPFLQAEPLNVVPGGNLVRFTKFNNVHTSFDSNRFPWLQVKTKGSGERHGIVLIINLPVVCDTMHGLPLRNQFINHTNSFAWSLSMLN